MVLQLMLWPWYLVTWEMIVRQALYLHEIQVMVKNKSFGEYLVNAQGEDVVAGTRTPKPVDMMREEMPDSYKTLAQTCARGLHKTQR